MTGHGIRAAASHAYGPDGWRMYEGRIIVRHGSHVCYCTQDCDYCLRGLPGASEEPIPQGWLTD